MAKSNASLYKKQLAQALNSLLRARENIDLLHGAIGGKSADYDLACKALIEQVDDAISMIDAVAVKWWGWGLEQLKKYQQY
jgi:hypothetical protein